MTWMFSRWIDYAWRLVTEWPPLGKWDGLSLIIAALGVVPTIIAFVASWRQGSKVQSMAVEGLADAIWNRLTTPALVSETSIRSLARTMEVSLHWPHLTDRAIAHALRRVALRAEETFKGRTLKRKLAVLNEPLVVFDKGGPPLLSIASRDRMWAYLLTGICLSIGIFAAQFWVTRVPVSMLAKASMIVALLVLQIILFSIALSGRRFWLAVSEQPNGQTSEISEQACNTNFPKHDFLVGYTMNTSHRVHTRWAPLWEDSLFGFLPNVLVLTLMIWIVYHIGRYFGVEETTLRRTTATITVLVVLWIVYFRIWVFSRWHAYELLRVRRLDKRLDLLVRDIKVARMGLMTITPETRQEAARLAEELWTLTGTDHYKQVRYAIENEDAEIQ